VRLDEVGLLVRLRFLLGFAEFLDQAHGAALEAAVEAAAGAGVEDVEEFVGGEVEKSVLIGALDCILVGFEMFRVLEWAVLGVEDVLVEVNASVGELAEGSLLLQFGRLLGILDGNVSLCVGFGTSELLT
jgi:hypothetical protein